MNKRKQLAIFLRRVSFRTGMLLNSGELAMLCHLPYPEVLEKRIYPFHAPQKSLMPPDLAPSVHYDAIGTLMSGNGHKNGPKSGPMGPNGTKLEVIGRKEKAQNPQGFQALKSGSGERI